MSAQLYFRFRNPALMMALAAVFPVVSYAAGAANVDFAAGTVTAVNAVGVQRPLTKGAEIGNGDTIRTGEGGRAQVRFSDGAMISLQPETEFRVDNYQFSGKTDGEEKGFFSLLKGGMRTITGLVGRVNRNNYKITTNVATIGIRGTEFTAVLGGGELHVNTGEGLIEVCNAAGCMLLASGESGIVSGSRSPSRTDSKPQLPPAQPMGPVGVVYSKSMDVGPTGTVLPVSTPLASSTGYAVAWAGMKGGSANMWAESPASGVTSFNTASVMTRFTDSYGASYDAAAIKGGFAADGVIGWGTWSSGSYTSSTALKDFHYVTGVPTSAGDLTALGGTTATYALAGFTTPTTSTGLTGGAPTATFTATFGGTGSLSLNLSVPVAGTTYSDTLSGSFSGSTINLSSACSSANGFFAGANASHAGMTYKLDGGSMFIMGGLAFKKQ